MQARSRADRWTDGWTRGRPPRDSRARGAAGAVLRVGLAGGGVVGGPPGTVCAPGLCTRAGLSTRAGLAGRPSLGASLERMGPGGGGGQVGSDRQLSPASDTAVAEGTQPCFTVPGGAPARPLPAGSQEVLRVPRAGVEVDVAHASDSAASPLRQRPGLSPSRVVAAAGGRETEARSAETAMGRAAGKGRRGSARRRQGARGSERRWGRCAGPSVRDSVHRAARASPRWGSVRSPHRRGCSGVPAPAQPSGRGQEAAVTV